MVKQISLDTWSLQHLTDLLKKGSQIAAKTNTPIVLYRQTMEEEDGSYEEIVCTLTNDYIVEQLIISGGMVIPAIKQQLVNNNCMGHTADFCRLSNPDKLNIAGGNHILRNLFGYNLHFDNDIKKVQAPEAR